MRKNLLKLGIGLLLSGAAVFSAMAVDARVTLSGHVPKIVAHLNALGVLPGTNNLTLAIGLPLRNADVLSNLLQQIYDPASTNYHKYLTPEQFTAQFGPTEQDYQSVSNFAKANGLTVIGTHPNRMLLDVSGQVTNIQKAFNVTMRIYRHPNENRNFYAPDTEPSIPANLPLFDIQGINNYVLPHSMLQIRRNPSAIPATGSGPQGGYIGKDFRNAYAPGTTLNGAGQTVGLLQFEGYFPNDITTYESLAGLTNVPLHNVLLDGFDGAPFSLDSEVEVCLDIETVISMAPGLSSVVVFEAGPFGNPNDILSSMTASNQIKQLSSSWGYQINGTTEQLYQQLALQGQTYLNCSGDGDAWVGPIPYGSCEDANITIVGGTTLTMNGTATSYASESAWNWGNIGSFSWNPDGYAGTSGGISTDVNIPSWQTNINMVANHGSTTKRNVPDVGLTADNVFVVAQGGNQLIVGGTSAATPLWGGFMALVNQQAVVNSKPSVGFLAPAVYALAETANYTNCFHDIVLGDNTWDQSLTNFFAVPGYDLCTGWGTPNGTNLINAFAGPGNITFTNPITHISAPLPPFGSTMSALNGGNPNGTWELFVQDDTPIDSGIISNGWSITLTMASPVGSAADQAVNMISSASVIPVGSKVVYSITVTNYGPSASTNVIVTDTLPPSGNIFVSASTTMGTTSRLGQTIVWSVGSLANGVGAQLTLTLQATANGNLFNYALVNSDTPDPNPDDDLVSSTVVVGTTAPPQLSGSVSGSGGTFQFTITGQSGQEYIVQASTNLVNWTPVYTNPAPYVSPFNFVDPNATNYVNRFYRVVTAP